MSFVLTIGIIASLQRDAWADEWQHVQSLETGTRIRIVTTGGVYTATGKVITSDSARIVIATAQGEQSIPRERVIRIDRDHTFLRAAPWIGMAIGAVWAGVAVAHESDFTKGGRLLWTGIGAGIGLGAGAVARVAFRYEPVYVANPKPAVTPPASMDEPQAIGQVGLPAGRRFPLLDELRQFSPDGRLRRAERDRANPSAGRTRACSR